LPLAPTLDASGHSVKARRASPQLRSEIGKLVAEDWHYWAREAGGKVREWAEVAYVPSRKVESKAATAYRYVAVRVRPDQGLLKAAALPPEMRHARPKRLRFLVFTHMGKLVSHAGQRMMKVARDLFEKLLGRPRARMRLLAWSAS